MTAPVPAPTSSTFAGFWNRRNGSHNALAKAPELGATAPTVDGSETYSLRNLSRFCKDTPSSALRQLFRHGHRDASGSESVPREPITPSSPNGILVGDSLSRHSIGETALSRRSGRLRLESGRSDGQEASPSRSLSGCPLRLPIPSPLHAHYSVAFRTASVSETDHGQPANIMSLENAYRHFPLGLQIPEQQSEFVSQASFFPAHSPPPPSHASRPLRLTPLDAAVQALE